jgi:hypothetical protein
MYCCGWVIYQQVGAGKVCPMLIARRWRRLISSTVRFACVCSRSNWRATQWVSHCAKLVHSFAYAATPLHVILRPALANALYSPAFICAPISASERASDGGYSYVFYFCDLVTGWLTYFPDWSHLRLPAAGSALAYYVSVAAFSHPELNRNTALGHDLHAAYRLASAQINENHTAINHALVCC